MYEDERAWLLVGEPPVGADQIAAVLAQLSGVDLACTLASLPEPGEVDAFTLVELAAGWEKVARFARAQVLCAVAELATLREVPRRVVSARKTRGVVEWRSSRLARSRWRWAPLMRSRTGCWPTR